MGFVGKTLPHYPTTTPLTTGATDVDDSRLVDLRVGLKAERDQRFKKPPEDRAVLWVQHLHGRGGQELLFIHAQEPGQDRIGCTAPLAEFSLRL